MKRILLLSFLLIILITSCSDYNHNISELPNDKINFSKVPQKVQDFFHDPSDYKWYNEEGIQIGIRRLIPINTEKQYELETKSSFVPSWIAYYRLIDKKNNTTYRIDQGTPSPFVIYNDKLYLQEHFGVFNSINEFNTLEFTCYSLKLNEN